MEDLMNVSTAVAIEKLVEKDDSVITEMLTYDLDNRMLRVAYVAAAVKAEQRSECIEYVKNVWPKELMKPIAFKDLYTALKYRCSTERLSEIMTALEECIEYNNESLQEIEDVVVTSLTFECQVCESNETNLLMKDKETLLSEPICRQCLIKNNYAGQISY